MARRRKAPARTKSGRATEPKVADAPQDESLAAEGDGNESRSESPETCPVCQSDPDASRKEDRTWVMCESCETWYHASCAGLVAKLETIDKWYCSDCVTKDPSRVVTFKAPSRKSTRTTNKVDYANLNDGIAGDPRRWFRHLNQKPMKKSYFKRMQGSEVSLEWLHNDERAMTEPIIIESPEGLGMKMPPSTFTVNDVAKLVGPREKVEVLDVASQREDKGWTLQTWADYYNKPAAEREKIRNVISLEISETKLADKIVPPRLVRELDWVEHMWPATKRKGAAAYPKVQMYCLMSVTECWTDWHLDFAGSSVYYHILKGRKTFYFIRPTVANLAAYEKWSGSETNQTSVWLGDWVDEVIKVELVAGNTMIIPTGWIHCVYTPEDSLIFGGNFLHSWNIATQLRVRALEIATKVPKKFRFPYFRKLCWYVGEKTLKDLKSREELPLRVLNGMDALARFLIKESRIIERNSSSETARKDSKEQVPGTIKDPTALARELRWRVRLAAGNDTDDELESPFSVKDKASTSAATSTNGKRSSATPLAPSTAATSLLKRKRGDVEERASTSAQGPRFTGFIPRQWDQMDLRSIEDGRVDLIDISDLPTKEDGLDWFQRAAEASGSSDQDHLMNGDSSHSASTSRRKAQRTRNTDEVVKLRRTLGQDGGVVTLERETIHRVYESWSFADADTHHEAESEDIRVEDVKPPERNTDRAYASQAPEAMDTAADNAIDESAPEPEGGTQSPLGIPPSGIQPDSVEEMLVDAGFTGTTSPAAPSILV